MAKQNFKINTPHAAIIVWNYEDRIVGTATSHKDQDVNKKIISTVSARSIQTSKTKSNPQGTFKLSLAPTQNWVSTLTPGSWCVILMSNKPFTQSDFENASADKVKMIGKIDTVRLQTQRSGDGTTRTSEYLVSGTDWGHIFNNVLYIDNFLAAAKDPKTQGQATAVAIFKMLDGNNGSQRAFKTPDNLKSLINVFGESFAFTSVGNEINRLAKSVYTFNIPTEMAKYFKFVDRDGKPVKSNKSINDILSFFHGRLIADDKYDLDTNNAESAGFINPYDLQGTHSFWQILMENSNPSMNEMLCDLRWGEGNTLQLAFYNRIKPFVFKDFKGNIKPANKVRSYFQYLAKHDIDDIDILSANVGTNWRDKYNFVEIKPNFQDFEVLANWSKTLAQKTDANAFTREGFRPLITETRQFPSDGADTNIKFENLDQWTDTMKEWYFDTHRMLNGTLTLVGQTQYIAVGDNVRFNADLVNPSPNFNSSAVSQHTNKYILGHVESVNHNFAVGDNGARTYQTTIEFVRGIFVDQNGIPLNGDGLIDDSASKLNGSENNSVNTFSVSDPSDPDTPGAVNG